MEGAFGSWASFVTLQGLTFRDVWMGQGNLTIIRSVVADGGGITSLYQPAGQVVVLESLVNNSVSGVSVGEAWLVNSTVSGNREAFRWGRVHLINSTVADNDRFSTANGASVTMANSLVDGDCGVGGTASNGYNIESPGDTCGFDHKTDQVNVPPEELMLEDLADNGGPTQTHALSLGSVAIGQIPSDECVDAEGAPLTTDQRGFPRDSMCDIGAFELQP
jgi:hypothetical protein